MSAGAHLLASAGTRAAGEQLRAPPAQGSGHHPEDRVEARLGCQSVGGGAAGMKWGPGPQAGLGTCQERLSGTVHPISVLRPWQHALR